MAGSALSLHDDLARAWAIYPGAPVIAVNGASREVKALALYSFHPERFVAAPFRWIERQRQFGTDFTVNGAKERPGMPWVDRWWPETAGGGGSAWGARKLAALLGFAPVVLCGCPMLPGPYVGHHGLGGFMTRDDVVDALFQGIERDADWHAGCFSMSGRTMALLGAPPC